jgi:hypothetical protein
LLKESADPATSRDEKFVEKADRVEHRPRCYCGHCIGFMWRWAHLRRRVWSHRSTLFSELEHETLIHFIIGAGFLLGLVGVGGLIGSCVNLFHATQLSLLNIRDEAVLIRARQKQ